MPEQTRPGRRATGISAGAVAGLAVGFFAGWLVFEDHGAAPTDLRPEIGRLSESVRKLSESVERLSAARPDAPLGAGPASAEGRPVVPRVEPGVKFRDTFETGTDGWFVARFAPEITGELARTEEEGQAKVGKEALALSYTLEPGKIPLALRMAPPVNRLSLWIRTLKRPAEVIVGVQERDESDYHTLIHIEPDDGWKHFEFDLATFVLGDDSTDENGRLDFHQIRSVAVVDAAGFMGGRGENVLLVDEVVGEYRAKERREAAEEGERF